MKAQEWIAKDFADRWSKPSPDADAHRALSDAYLKGFLRGKEEAAGLMESMNNAGAAILIRAMFHAEVDPETGKRLDSYGEDKET